MDIEQAEGIIDALTDAGIDADLIEGYSALGMFGRQTAAVTTNTRAGMLLIGWAAGKSGMEPDAVERLRTDDLVVVY